MLQINQIHFERQDRQLFAPVSFAANSGETWQIIGKNGSGKTTLLRIIAGLLIPSSGDISWNKQNIDQVKYYFNANLLFVGHRDAIKIHLSAIENLNLLQSLHKPTSTSIENVLSEIGLSKAEQQTPCRQLSEGQRRRVALARLRLCKAQLWLLDEPLTALDTHTIEVLLSWLKQHAAAEGIAVISSHQALAIPNLKTFNLQADSPCSQSN